MSTLDEVKSHPFFAGVNWSSLREGAAPFIPALDSEVEYVLLPPPPRALLTFNAVNSSGYFDDVILLSPPDRFTY